MKDMSDSDDIDEENNIQIQYNIPLANFFIIY